MHVAPNHNLYPSAGMSGTGTKLLLTPPRPPFYLYLRQLEAMRLQYVEELAALRETLADSQVWNCLSVYSSMRLAHIHLLLPMATYL